MKKQTNPTIKAYLLRGAFYLLFLMAVGAIPFALAQRNSTWHSTQSHQTPGAGSPAVQQNFQSSAAAEIGNEHQTGIF